MRLNDEIISQLKVLTSFTTYCTDIGWLYFKFNGYQMLFIPSKNDSNVIRICIPHFEKAEAFDSRILSIAINETNREVMFVKVTILGNGSISLNYDHKYIESTKLKALLNHILRALYFAAEHLKTKLYKK